jgi:hypothetical protein
VIDARQVLCGFALALSMCARGQREPAAAPSGAPSQALPPPGYPAGLPATPGAPPTSAPAPAYTYPAPPVPENGGAAPVPREAQRAAARDELARAEGTLQASPGDCATACRALESLERAVGRLCALVDSTDDQRRCDDARQRLATARERVRQTCGACSP